MTVLVSVTVVVGPSSVVVAVSVSVEVGPFTVTVTVSVVVEPPSVAVTYVQTVFVLVRVTVFVFVFQSVLVTVFVCPPNANAAAVVAVAVEHAGSDWPRLIVEAEGPPASCAKATTRKPTRMSVVAESACRATPLRETLIRSPVRIFRMAAIRRSKGRNSCLWPPPGPSMLRRLLRRGGYTTGPFECRQNTI